MRIVSACGFLVGKIMLAFDEIVDLIEGKFLALGRCRNVDLVKGVLLQEDHVEEEGLLLDHEVLHGNPLLTWIYSIPTAALHAAPAISTWIREAVKNPVLIGPDSESEQWVAAVAQDAGAPFVVLDKTCRGDRDVEVSIPHVDRWRDRTPVLVDDIISTARTMHDRDDWAPEGSRPGPAGLHRRSRCFRGRSL